MSIFKLIVKLSVWWHGKLTTGEPFKLITVENRMPFDVAIIHDMFGEEEGMVYILESNKHYNIVVPMSRLGKRLYDWFDYNPFSDSTEP